MSISVWETPMVGWWMESIRGALANERALPRGRSILGLTTICMIFAQNIPKIYVQIIQKNVKVDKRLHDQDRHSYSDYSHDTLY